jgi:hypothetical protein
MAGSTLVVMLVILLSLAKFIQGMEVDGKRFILTPGFDGKGERVERRRSSGAGG